MVVFSFSFRFLPTRKASQPFLGQDQGNRDKLGCLRHSTVYVYQIQRYPVKDYTPGVSPLKMGGEDFGYEPITFKNVVLDSAAFRQSASAGSF